MFRAIDNSNRFAAMDIVEDVAAGARGGDRAEMRAAVGVLLARGSDQSEATAAAATALQEDWPGRYGGANTAMMMAGAVAASRIGHEPQGESRTSEDDALAAGRFHHLKTERQDEIASHINRGTLLSARDRHDISELYAAELAMAPAPAGLGDGQEAVRRSIDVARSELGVGPSEWHGPGDRGAVSFLLHVQAPALLRVAGAEDRGDPANAPYIQQEAERIAANGLGAPGTIHGFRHNLGLMREMSQWLAPTLSEAGIAASSADGPIARLAEAVDREVAGRARPGRGAAQAVAAGMTGIAG